MGINTGILQNATPLSSAAIKELERRVVENGEAFAYLDENSQLCFISAHTPEAIKDLAWNNAYELSAQDDKLIKKCFKKRSLRDYSLKDTLQKISFEDFWETYKAWRVLASDGKVPAECEIVNSLTEEMFLPGDALPELNNPFFMLTVGDCDNDVSYGYLLLQKGFRSIDEARDYLALVCTLYGEEITSEDLANMDDVAWQQYKTFFPLLNTLDTGITENTFVPSEPTFFWGLFAIGAYFDKLDNLYCELFDLPVLYIDRGVFLNAKNQVIVTLPNSITELYPHAFIYVDTLAGITFADSIDSIPEGAFEECINLTEVTLNNNIKSINSGAFYKCENLSNIALGDSIVAIGDHAFFGCKSLKAVNLPGSLISIGDYAFYSSGLTEIVLPNSITNIPDSCFMYCRDLQSVTIPSSVTSISSHAFFYSVSPSIKSVYINDITAWCNISFEDHASNPLYQGAALYLNNNLITSLALPDTVYKIPAYAFYAYTYITDVLIPSSVVEIGDSAFDSCSSLTFVNISSGVETIGRHAFGFCSNLTSIIIPDSITTIDSFAFTDCSALSDIKYLGTVEQWYAINKTDPRYAIFEDAKASYIQCSDGQISTKSY